MLKRLTRIATVRTSFNCGTFGRCVVLTTHAKRLNQSQQSQSAAQDTKQSDENDENDDVNEENEEENEEERDDLDEVSVAYTEFVCYLTLLVF